MAIATAGAAPAARIRTREKLESVTVRFAGDSGDGMQLAGTQLTNTSALAGNDVATFPDFPVSDGLFCGGVEHRQAARGAPLSAVDGHRVVGHRRRIEHEQTYLSID
jgi:hypothetical protein